jgi:deoxyhypusine monooxygenase
MELPPLAVLEKVLTSQAEPLTKRIRALFYLRTIGTDEVVPIIAKGFADPSLLLQHEVCYVLGQISLPSAVPFLVQVLVSESNADISRHEAAEALGAIAEPASLPLLSQYKTHPLTVLAETCELAIDRIAWTQTGEQ